MIDARLIVYCAVPPGATDCVAGDTEMVKSGGRTAVPVPVSEDDCVVGEALSVTVSVAE